ncbi:MAG: hypothetical protein OES84_03345, partial [Kiritimatiellaceae bacterium]|nr:hypothetical protein [Kiritimatiellaceae bacterium]
DSYLQPKLPATGTYFVEIGDTQSKGGHEYAYRLRISKSNPDFKLRMDPSGLHIGPQGTAAFTVRAMRQDGYNGAIKLESKNLPEGFSMSDATIPAGSDTTRFTITAPKEITGKLVSPQITGTAIINSNTVTHTAIPVDDQMQAFLYRHLVPAKELMLAEVSQKPPLAFEAKLPKSGIIEVPLGQEFRIQLTGQAFSTGKGASVKFDNPPEGISSTKGWIGRKRVKGKKANGQPEYDKNHARGSITLTAEEPLKLGDRLSLVVVAEIRKGKEKLRYPAPAIPVKIVAPVEKKKPTPKAETKSKE